MKTAAASRTKQSMSYVFLDVQIGKSPSSRIIIELFETDAPETCRYFKSLLNQPNGYKGTRFHRIIEEFMIQGGDVKFENDDAAEAALEIMENMDHPIDKMGLVGLARRSAAENNPQFFITLAPSQHLQGQHTIFGRVVKGTEMVERISQVEVDDTDRPIPDNEVVIIMCGELQSRHPVRSSSRNFTSPERVTERSREKDRRPEDRSRSPQRDSRRHRGRSRSTEYHERRSHRTSDGEIDRRRGRHHHRHHHRRDAEDDSDNGNLEKKDYSKSPERRELSRDRRDNGGDDGESTKIPTGPRGYKPRSRYKHESNYGRLGYDVNYEDDIRDDEDRLREVERRREGERGRVEPKVIFKGRGVMKFRERY